MKVLHLIWEGGIGGTQRYLASLLKAPYWKNAEHHVCFFSSDGVVLNAKLFPRITFFALEMKNGWDVQHGLQLSKIVQKASYDVIHAHTETPTFLAQVPFFKKSAIFYTEHGDSLLRQQNHLGLKLAWKVAGRYFKGVFCNSNFSKESLITKYSFLAEKCRVLYNPLPEIWSGPHGPTLQSIKLGFFGRLVAQKGVDVFIKLIHALQQRNVICTGHVYGTGPLLPELLQLQRELYLEKTLFFEGFVSNPLEAMAKMDLVVMPSVQEPFGLVAIEAQSVGTPVIAFKVGGLPEVIKQGLTGLLIYPEDLTALVDASEQLIRDPMRRQKMGEQAKEFALANFSMQKHIQALERAYSEV